MLVRTIRFLGASASLLAASAISAGAQGSWNAENDFGATNPSGPWSYGASTTLGGTFHQSAVYTPNCDPTETPHALNYWGDVRTDAGQGKTQVIKNVTGSPVTYGGNGVTQPANELGLSFALDTAFTILRFTAPHSGTLNVSGTFENIFCCAQATVYVLLNSGASRRCSMVG